jgi:hypothetical protein
MQTTVLTKGRPDLSSERVSHRDKTATLKRKNKSGYKSQSELDTKTY